MQLNKCLTYRFELMLPIGQQFLILLDFNLIYTITSIHYVNYIACSLLIQFVCSLSICLEMCLCTFSVSLLIYTISYSCRNLITSELYGKIVTLGRYNDSLDIVQGQT